LSETDDDFLDGVEDSLNHGDAVRGKELHRLLRLARRGAAVPDEPAYEMLEAAADAWVNDPDQKLSTVYRAMIQAALRKDTP